jgi:hypothetical protein
MNIAVLTAERERVRRGERDAVGTEASGLSVASMSSFTLGTDHEWLLGSRPWLGLLVKVTCRRLIQQRCERTKWRRPVAYLCWPAHSISKFRLS